MPQCIKVIDLFGEKIKSIESNFVDGVADGKAQVNLATLVAEVQLKRGMPQGVYRVERDGVVALGLFRETRVRGPCWMIWPTRVSTGIVYLYRRNEQISCFRFSFAPFVF